MNTPKDIIKEYEDRYDEVTIELCYDHLRPFDKPIRANIIELFLGTEIIHAPYPEEERDNILVTVFIITHIINQRKEEKSEAIKQWIQKTAEERRSLEAHRPIHTIRCSKCNARSKAEESFINNEDDQILTFYRCTKGCLPMQVLYPDRTPYIIPKSICENCYYDMKPQLEKTKTTSILKDTCIHCGYINICSVEDTSPKKRGELLWWERMREAFCE